MKDNKDTLFSCLFMPELGEAFRAYSDQAAERLMHMSEAEGTAMTLACAEGSPFFGKNVQEIKAMLDKIALTADKSKTDFSKFVEPPPQLN